MRATTVVMGSLALLALAACGGATPIPASNTTVSGVVRKVTRVQPSCYAIEYMLNQCGKDYYSLEMASDDAKTWYADVGSSQIDEDDVRRVIGETITLSCYRAPERQFSACSQRLSSLVWQGRELVHPTKT